MYVMLLAKKLNQNLVMRKPSDQSRMWKIAQDSWLDICTNFNVIKDKEWEDSYSRVKETEGTQQPDTGKP